MIFMLMRICKLLTTAISFLDLLFLSGRTVPVCSGHVVIFHLQPQNNYTGVSFFSCHHALTHCLLSTVESYESDSGYIVCRDTVMWCKSFRTETAEVLLAFPHRYHNTAFYHLFYFYFPCFTVFYFLFNMCLVFYCCLLTEKHFVQLCWMWQQIFRFPVFCCTNLESPCKL